MSVIIFNAPNHAIFEAQAIALGFAEAIPAQPGNYGGVAKNGDNFELYYFFTVYYNPGGDVVDPVNGVFGRLEIKEPSVSPKPFDENIIQYWYSTELHDWTCDGVTKAPIIIGKIGHSPV